MERNNYISCVGGGKVSYTNPLARQFTLEPMLCGLSNQCRFVGQVSRFYSVAEHSVRCSWQARPEHALEALLHDMHEAWVHDVVSPLKCEMRALQGQHYSTYDFIEDEVRRAALLQLAPMLSIKLSEPVKEIDLRMLVTECTQLGHEIPPVFSDVAPYQVAWYDRFGWGPKKARKMFLRRLKELHPFYERLV